MAEAEYEQKDLTSLSSGPPVLLDPRNSVNSCNFKLVIQANGPVTVSITYPALSFNQIARTCRLVGSVKKPGPVGKIRIDVPTSPNNYETEVCLCDLPDGCTIRIKICYVVNPLNCSQYDIVVNHGGNCDPCNERCAEIDDVVNELTQAIIERVAQELRDLLDKFRPRPKPKHEIEAPVQPKVPRRRGRRRRRK
jgi:hypothetical protein